MKRAASASWSRTSGATSRPPIPSRESEGIGLLAYGHTHQPELRLRGHVPGRVPVIWLNPGSCMAPLRNDPRRSYGLVVVRDGEPDARIVFLP